MNSDFTLVRYLSNIIYFYNYIARYLDKKQIVTEPMPTPLPLQTLPAGDTGSLHQIHPASLGR